MRIIIAIIVVLAILSSFSFAQSCDYGIELLIEGTEFTIESFKWKMKAIKIEGDSTNITGIARIEDLNGNIIKSYKPWTSQSISKQKTSNEYSPNLKEGEYNIRSEIEVECYDTNKNNDISIKSVKIRPEAVLENKIVEQKNKEDSQNATIEPHNAQEKKETINVIENETMEMTAENNSERAYNNVINLKKEDEMTADAVRKYNGNGYAYLSSNEKSKNLVIYMLIGISAIIILALIWKR